MISEKLKHSLFNHIEKWLSETPETCEFDWPPFYIHDALCKQMTDAAIAVFESSVDGQEKLDQEEPR